MKKTTAHQRRKEFALSLIDIKGEGDGEVLVRIGGHKFDTINMAFRHPDKHGLPNDDETKKVVLSTLLEGATRHRINRLMGVISPEDLVHLFLNFDQYQRLADLTKEELDSDPHNRVALAKAIVEQIVEPYGMSFEVKNSIAGLSINIGLQGHYHQLN